MTKEEMDILIPYMDELTLCHLMIGKLIKQKSEVPEKLLEEYNNAKDSLAAQIISIREKDIVMSIGFKNK